VIPGDPEVPLPDNFLHLFPARDNLGWDITGIGSSVGEASVDVFDHNGGFAGTSTSRVRFTGEFDAITLRPPDTAQIYTLDVTNDTIGENGLSLGFIVSITLIGAIDADFGNITLTINHKHCPCDFNQDNAYTVGDLFSYLASYFAQDDRSDFNEDGETTVQDIFDFLACWFSPATSGLRFCP
jgi:hypothetical protein